MAALDRKITIGIEYRPCMVHIPAKKQSYRKKGDRINVYEKEIEPEREIKAMFHCWNHRSELYDASPMIGGHPGGQVSGTFAIVEYEDGTVHEAEPQNIRFVDNAMREYAFTEEDKNTGKWRDLECHCPECKNGIMRRDESMILTSNPPKYKYKCDKCGHMEYSFGRIDVSEVDEDDSQ